MLARPFPEQIPAIWVPCPETSSEGDSSSVTGSVTEKVEESEGTELDFGISNRFKSSSEKINLNYKGYL